MEYSNFSIAITHRRLHILEQLRGQGGYFRG
jgi:hypothetical protein